MITSTIEAVTSSIALMICTQVVATMPPNSTYPSISTPTTTTEIS
jgi:hypothetical protein